MPVEESGGDEILRILARITQESDDPDTSMGITLTVRGTTITGLLIGRDDWLRRFRALAGKAGETGEVLGDALIERYLNIDLHRPADEEPVYAFVHLMNAYILGSANSLSPGGPDGFLWRGRISEVSGWAFGHLKP